MEEGDYLAPNKIPGSATVSVVCTMKDLTFYVNGDDLYSSDEKLCDSST
jgi:hypothetical protein